MAALSAAFTYDGYNRLVQSSKENTRYTYDALGRRIRKANQNGLSTIFHYGQNGELLFEKDQSGNTKAYVWLDGRPLARIDNNKQIYYYHVDHLGTPQAMTNSTGTVVWKADYEPFGKATVSPASTVENNLRFPGQYYDRETGLHYNYFRDYDPRMGRYVEVDPIGLEGGINPYAYANNAPTMYTDPLGLKPVPCPPGLPPGATCDDGSDNDNAPPKCATGECACDLPPPRLPDPCNEQCGLGSPDWAGRSIICRVVSGGASVAGLPGMATGLVCKAIDKWQCVRECKRRRGVH